MSKDQEPMSNDNEQVAQEDVLEQEIMENKGNDAIEVSLEAKIIGLEADVDQKSRQAQEADERLKRLQADFENFRRRTRQEKEELSNVVAQNIVKDLLPLLDNFDRALVSMEEGSAKDGVIMIAKQFAAVLDKNGLEKINSVGEKFDPNYHEAIMRIVDDSKEDDTVVEELQPGYIVHGRVIRPSMVKVVAN